MKLDDVIVLKLTAREVLILRIACLVCKVNAIDNEDKVFLDKLQLNLINQYCDQKKQFSN